MAGLGGGPDSTHPARKRQLEQGDWHPSIEVYYLAKQHPRAPSDVTLYSDQSYSSTCPLRPHGSALTCCWICAYTVETAGQPTPGPCRFWSVESSVAMRACLSALDPPVGNGAGMLGLCTMWPAATFVFKDCGLGPVSVGSWR